MVLDDFGRAWFSSCHTPDIPGDINEPKNFDVVATYNLESLGCLVSCASVINLSLLQIHGSSSYDPFLRDKCAEFQKPATPRHQSMIMFL